MSQNTDKHYTSLSLFTSSLPPFYLVINSYSN